MVKTTTTSTSSNNGDATKKKSLFGKIFKKSKNNKAQQQPEAEERKVEILIEHNEEIIMGPEEDEAREGAEEIPRDPSASMLMKSSSPAAAAAAAAAEKQPETADPDYYSEHSQQQRRGKQGEEVRDGADILVDLKLEEASVPPNKRTTSTVSTSTRGWMGGWLDNMANLCAPIDQDGLPTIMSGEEMDMDLITNGRGGESLSVMSPTSTVTSVEEEVPPPLSPIAAAPKEQERARKQAPENKKKEKEQKDYAIAYTEPPTPPQQEQPKPVERPAPMDAPTTPKSLMVSPRVMTKLEPEEDLASSPPKSQHGLKEEDDNTLIVSPEKGDDDNMVHGLAAEPVGTKVDIFASLTACCHPMAVPSMDETDKVKQHMPKQQQEPPTAAAAAALEQYNKEKADPVGDKGHETKSVAQDSQSVMTEAETKKKEEAPTTPLATTPVAKTFAKKPTAAAEENGEQEEERIVGTIFKEKKNTKMGLSLKNSTMYQGVFIAKIKPGSLFSQTKLREGMQVYEIQGKPCPVALEEAVNILRHAVGELSIVAHKPKCEI